MRRATNVIVFPVASRADLRLCWWLYVVLYGLAVAVAVCRTKLYVQASRWETS